MDRGVVMRNAQAAAPLTERPKFNERDACYAIHYRDDRVFIYGDGPLIPAALARSIALEVRESMDFSMRLLGWDREPGIRRPMRVYVLTKPHMEQRFKSAQGGSSMGPDVIVLCRDEMRDEPEYRVNTEAHEALHSLHWRVDLSDWNATYYYEGLACVMAARFAARGGLKVGWIKDEADWIVTWTPEQARRVFNQFRGSSAYDRFPGPGFDVGGAELTSGLAIEFFRLRYGPPGMAGYRPLGAISLAINKGATFEQAFEQAFNVPLKTAENAFVEHMRATIGRPKARLAGTVWATGG
jgi:hypothetical protein